ncbi:hypothetical protein JMJ77_0007525 [Colletotrichum scovillei]|uniref:Uncharacterized protein n=1 Tax=Colletotrichum scovillei TaxID=1209932 RepID=A0A9P7RD01_9PEZI|nr:hypothetical protein JMJ77_0007525 [Colletotrichum scovillei]KAG7074501.1 hypothetical protein JMJ76_0010979 [Colletotrichum scovillei]KAG7081842.1 hypothetical protein JMJ78_0003954 [Colletotrichum scovillei]
MNKYFCKLSAGQVKGKGIKSSNAR